MISLLVWLRAEVRYLLRGWLPWALGQLGYAVRPYDMLLDARRWRWQPAGRCGLVVVEMDPGQCAVLSDAARRAFGDDVPRCPGCASPLCPDCAGGGR